MDPSLPPPPPSLDGYYRSGAKRWSYMKIAGAKVSYHEAGRDVFDRVTAELGEFNSADENIREASGREKYNLKFVIYFDPKNPTVSFDMFGVVSEDREKIFFLDTASRTEVVVSERISEEEAREVERDGTDPITAPPGPFTLQPEKQGRLVVISGPPGAGKSTSAQLLGRRAGWVYYEVDCFLQLRNPFIPLDVPNPTIQQSRQRTLAGEGREERKALCDKVGGIWSKMVKQEEISEEQWGEMENYIRVLCEDINTQRRRIGGDWAIAGCFPFRRIRDVLRASLGEELIVVSLVMGEDEVCRRLSERHSGQESLVTMLMNINKLCLDPGEEEDGVLVVKVDQKMTRDDVVDDILRKIEQYLNK